jgi:hypothetical protein
VTLKDVPPTVWLIAVGAVVAVILARQLAGAAKAAGQAVNPTNPDNVFHSGVNQVGAAVSGDESFSLGAWIFDITHPGG